MGAVDKAWDAVSVSFDRFCLTAGIEALGTMMEQDAEQACGARHAPQRWPARLSLSSITRFLRRWRTTGNVGPAKFGGHKQYALESHEDQFKQLVRDRPDLTLKQLRARLLKRHEQARV
jgi:transposase